MARPKKTETTKITKTAPKKEEKIIEEKAAVKDVVKADTAGAKKPSVKRGRPAKKAAETKAASPAAKKTEAKPAAKKSEAKPTAKKAETKPAAKKAEAKPAAKKAEAKPAAAKTAAKKPAAKASKTKEKAPEAKSEFVLQYAGASFDIEQIKARVDEAVKKSGVRKVKAVGIYVKPEERKVFFTINGKGDEAYKLDI